MKTTREPKRDVAAQVAAVADPASAKRAAFMAKGTKVPARLPAGTAKISRPEGTLVTNSPVHAAAFAAPGPLGPRMPGLLGYPESKGSAIVGNVIARGTPVVGNVIARGTPVVVQGRKGNAVVHESLASPRGLLAAGLAAKAAVPKGRVVVTTPAAVQARRKGLR